MERLETVEGLDRMDVTNERIRRPEEEKKVRLNPQKIKKLAEESKIPERTQENWKDDPNFRPFVEEVTKLSAEVDQAIDELVEEDGE